MGSMTHQYSIVLMSTPPLSPPKYWLQIGVQQHLSGLCCVLVGITLPLFGKPARKWIAVCSFSFYIQYVQCENLRNGVDVIFFLDIHVYISFLSSLQRQMICHLAES